MARGAWQIGVGTTPAPFNPAGATDADVVAWVAAVVANGGTVSPARQMVVQNFVVAEKAGGPWALTDDYFPLWAENQPQALTSLKQLRLATAVNAPTFVADRHYAGNGTSSYINTGFSIATHGVAITGTTMRIAVYQRNDVASASPPMAVSETATRACLMRTKGATNFPTLQLNCTIINAPGTVATSAGFTVASRTAVPVFEMFKNGASIGTLAATSPTGTRPTQPVYIGCSNNNGTAANFSTAQIGFACIGGALTAGQEAAQHANVQAWATAVGAAV